MLGVLQHTDFCFGETKRLCKAAAVKAIIRVALLPAVKSTARSRMSWSKPHQAPPAASPLQTQQQFLEDCPAHSLFFFRAFAAGERASAMPNKLFVRTSVHVCITQELCYSNTTPLWWRVSIFLLTKLKRKIKISVCCQQNRQILVLLGYFLSFEVCLVLRKKG